MKLEDVAYFAAKKQSQPSVFQLAQKVYDACKADAANDTEIQRRLSLLSRSTGAEHLRQCGNFMAELVAFDDLLSEGLSPKWLPESTTPGVKAPDIEADDGTPTPV
jgi:hypothetical protein